MALSLKGASMRAQDQENDLGGNRRSKAGRGSARSSLPGPAAGLLALQRSAGNAAVTRAIEEQRHEHGPGCGHADRSVQRAAETDEALRATVQREVSLAEVTGSGGSSLDPRIQAKAEQAYGMPLGHVRVHNDATAQRASADFQAHAMTVGHHIVLGSSRVDDETMFHELDHVRQQSQGPVAGTDNGSGVKVSDPGDAFERQSATNGRLVAQGSTPDLSLPGSAGHGAPVQRAATATGERQSVQRMPKEATKSKAGRGGKKATVAQAITRALVQNHGWKEYGGQQNKTVHFPIASDNAPAHAKSEGLKGAALSAMYHGTDNIRKERSFSAERPEQALRWISTVTFNYLNDLRKQPEEVQAGVSAVQQEGPEGAATRFQLYISSNKDGANKALTDLYEGKASAAEFLTAILKAGEPNLSSRTALEQRHAQKLASRLLGDGQGRDAYSAVLQALGGSVNVPAKRRTPPRTACTPSAASWRARRREASPRSPGSSGPAWSATWNSSSATTPSVPAPTGRARPPTSGNPTTPSRTPTCSRCASTRRRRRAAARTSASGSTARARSGWTPGTVPNPIPRPPTASRPRRWYRRTPWT